MIAVVGGTGVGRLGLLEGRAREERVVTPFGSAYLQRGEYRGVDIVFLPRHGPGHTVPPHRINYRANIWALRQAGVRRVVATAAVGALNPELRPGDFVLVDQFLDFTRQRPATFFDGGEHGVQHVDVTEPYCPLLRSWLAAAAAGLGIPVHRRGVYACTEGPRYETPAEVRALRLLGGDVVGMTGVPEVVLAREAGLCYATLATVTNMAAGLSPEELSHEAVEAVVAANAENAQRLLRSLLDRWVEEGQGIGGPETAEGEGGAGPGEPEEEPPCQCRQTAGLLG